MFSSAGDAVAAAADVQGALAGFELAVRIGMHTGEAVIRDGGYVGLDVHSRLASRPLPTAGRC